MRIRLGDIAHARSGDKGSAANIGVIARSAAAYAYLDRALTPDAVAAFLSNLNSEISVSRSLPIIRYALPNLRAFNFVLPTALAPGGSLSLRSDAQGKALGQILLEMPLEAPDDTCGAGFQPARTKAG
jgi:hypothetical protein